MATSKHHTKMASTNTVQTFTRTFNVPKHVGTNILPDFPLFHRLLYLATVQRNVAIEDAGLGVHATHAQLLSDVLHLRNELQVQLGAEVSQRLLRGEEVYICLLTNGGYEFAVGFLAVIALGAVLVPISVSASVEEAVYFMKTCSASAILTNTVCRQKGSEVAAAAVRELSRPFTSVEIMPALSKPVIPLQDIIISSDHTLLLTDPGLVIFTSGTTGRPKAALKKRGFFTDNSEAFARWWGYSDKDVVLHVLPVHHATGISVTFLGPLVSGARIEFGASSAGWRFSPGAMWERWLRGGGLTVFSGVPTMYQRMMRHYQDEIVPNSTPEVIESYRDAARSFRLLLCGTSALPHSLQAKWAELLSDGRKILERYGGTEFSGVFSVEPGDAQVPDGSAGKVLPGVEVKLSKGDQGEILIRSPHMFSKYLGNPEATATVFEADGWYKSGDVARREGEYFFMLGRASIDIIKSGGYKLSALEIERELVGLDYVNEAIVVGVEDAEYGQKVAAAIVLRKGTLKEPLRIEKLRSDLRKRLSPYKLPMLLRVVGDFPRTASGKVIKSKVRDSLFSTSVHPDVQEYKKGQSRL